MSNVLKDSSILLNDKKIKDLLNEIKINWIDECLNNRFKWYPYWANEKVPNTLFL